MNNKQISKNFYSHEFKNATPHPDLLEFLQLLRDHTGLAIIITDSKREPWEHVGIYKRLHGADWLKHIPWQSRHLPTYKKPFEGYLRGVDFGMGNLTGEQIKEKIYEIKPDRLKIGLGVGKKFVHLDIDRQKDREWSYNY